MLLSFLLLMAVRSLARLRSYSPYRVHISQQYYEAVTLLEPFLRILNEFGPRVASSGIPVRTWNTRMGSIPTTTIIWH